MAETPLLTIIVPTYRRPTDLGRLLGYLAGAPIPLALLVLDSSPADQARANQTIVEELSARTGVNLDYRHLPGTTTPFEKFRFGAYSAATRYAVICADDDVVLLDRLADLLAVLEATPQAVGVHGRYVGFELGKGPRIRSLIYDAPSIADDGPALRLARLLRRYEALSYAVYRTEVLRAALDAAAAMPTPLFQELAGSVAAVCLGPVIRVEAVTHGRNLAPSHGYRFWHPAEYIYPDPERMVRDYMSYRAALLPLLGGLNDGERLFDLLHLRYLAAFAPARVVASHVEATLEGVAEPQALARGWRALYTTGNAALDAVLAHPLIGGPLRRLRNWAGAASRYLVPAALTGDESRTSQATVCRFAGSLCRSGLADVAERERLTVEFARYWTGG